MSKSKGKEFNKDLDAILKKHGVDQSYIIVAWNSGETIHRCTANLVELTQYFVMAFSENPPVKMAVEMALSFLDKMGADKIRKMSKAIAD